MVYDLLKKLSDAHGVSGFEDNIKNIVRKELEGYVDEFREDTLGNLIAVRKGSDFSVMIASHMDEIGLMVQYVDEKGFIKFVGIGGWYNPSLYTRRVILHGTRGPVIGVLGAKPPHIMTPEDRKKEIKMDDLFIDVGVSSADEVTALGIEIGTPITIEQEFTRLAGDRVSGKALDNRVGVAVLIEVIKRMKTPLTVYGVFTVQEEIGLKGAKVSAFALNPDVAIATDVTIPGDHPGVSRKDASPEMGKGPVLVLASASGRGLLADRRLTTWLRNAGDKAKIPYQLEVGEGGNTDASIINLVRDGIPSIPFSVPARYIHSPVEVVDLADVNYSIDLLVEALKKKPKL
ncbi:MAG: M42 family metallopeptidase [Methanospirillum sp.]|uniref:M42 family metallopeptidase n=1 Tax=Methanospirillum sp. TaxID=45200 RepID=UPI00236E5441|nr:M42 family metallopeptidase [Methanospirillum sp.]MDD1730381.1 M42 family metallopeptidase [Methanospirillum sp.]